MFMQFLSFVFMLISLLFVVLTFLCSRFLFNHHKKISEGIDGKSKLIELDLEDKG
jgi:sensor histidine kinase YesM